VFTSEMSIAGEFGECNFSRKWRGAHCLRYTYFLAPNAIMNPDTCKTAGGGKDVDWHNDALRIPFDVRAWKSTAMQMKGHGGIQSRSVSPSGVSWRPHGDFRLPGTEYMPSSKPYHEWVRPNIDFVPTRAVTIINEFQHVIF